MTDRFIYDENRFKQLDLMLRQQLKDAGIPLSAESDLFPNKDLVKGYSGIASQYQEPEYNSRSKKVTGANPDQPIISRIVLCRTDYSNKKVLEDYKRFQENPNNYQKATPDIARAANTIHELIHRAENHSVSPGKKDDEISVKLLHKALADKYFPASLSSEYLFLIREDLADTGAYAWLKATDSENPRIDEAIQRRIVEREATKTVRHHTHMLRKFASEYSGNKTPLSEGNIIEAVQFAGRYVQENLSLYKDAVDRPEDRNTAKEFVCGDADLKGTLKKLQIMEAKPTPAQ